MSDASARSGDGFWATIVQRITALERRIPRPEGNSGDMKMIAGDAAPAGWMLCQGQVISRYEYPALFAAIGTKWGAGDGSTTFSLPDMRGRVPVGRDSNQAEFDTVGEAGGAKSVTLTEAQTPWRRTSAEAPGYGLSGSSNFIDRVGVGGVTASAFSIMPPYVIVNYVIRL